MGEPMDHLLDTMIAIEIDADGDLILILGAGRLKVSSKILSLASNVFKAMFKQGFKEGNTMHNNIGALQYIELPDDDFHAITFMCRIIHHNPLRLSKCSIDEITDLAIVADKYDCTAAISL